MNNIVLHKMNGLGNKFLILDARKVPSIQLNNEKIITLSSPKNQETGGCDQFIVLKNSNECDVFMQIYNTDGGEVDACGNATRCIAWFISNEVSEATNISIETNNSNLICSVDKADPTIVTVEMPPPVFQWNKIPLSHNVDDILNLPVDFLSTKGSAVSMGNPHLVFIVKEDVETLNLNEIGPPYENNELYPKRTNVSFANIIDESNIRLRVFERGVGETLACGTAACATHAIARKKGLVKNNSNIILNGGILKIEWSGSNNENLIMSGKTEYNGQVKIDLL